MKSREDCTKRKFAAAARREAGETLEALTADRSIGNALRGRRWGYI